MQPKSPFTCRLFAIAVLFIFGCNEATENAATDSRDTMTTAAASADNKPSFDTSRSVTTISPDLYQKLADTLNIKVLKGSYKPGDSSIMHAHPDFALYVMDGSTVELTMTDGTKQNIEFKKGMAVVLPATSHSAKNIGKTTLNLIVVEVNRPRQ